MRDEKSKTASYAASGVDIDAGDALVEKIKPLAKSTVRSGCMAGLGGFGALFDLKAAGYDDPILVSGTDGVGTKLKLAIESGLHGTIGVDLVAMCVNDLIVQGAEPLFFLDYYATGKLEPNVAASVIAGIAEGCKQAGCALIGGETAEMPGLYAAEDYDLAGFAVGAVNRESILPRMGKMGEGDVLLGLASSGIHSNGFSLVRHILNQQQVKLSDAAPFASGKSWAETLLEPTRIYVPSCLKAIQAHPQIHGFCHITGGGLLENLPRILPAGMGGKIRRESWQAPLVFGWLAEAGPVEPREMLRTFNCGIGMVLVVEAGAANAVKATLEEEGETVYTIGALSTETTGIEID